MNPVRSASLPPVRPGGRFRLRAIQALGLALLGAGLACSSGPDGPAAYAPSITTQPKAQTIPAGTPVSFTVDTLGVPLPTYAWQRSDDAGRTWTPLQGATDRSYAFTPHVADSGAEFRVLVANASGQVLSEAATLTVPPAVYVGGASGPAGGYWLNGTFVAQDGSSGGCVNALAVAGGHVYAAGYAMTSQSLNPGFWLDGTWTGLAPMAQGGQPGGFVQALVLSGNDVYAAGFASPGGMGYFPGYWLNGAWNGLALPPGWDGCRITSFAADGGHLFEAGFLMNFTGGGAAGPGYWMDGAWVPLPLPPGADSGQVEAMAVSGGTVYVAGSVSAPGTSTLGYWADGTWTPLALPDGATRGAVNAIAFQGGHVYFAGFSDAPGWQVPGFWLDGTWRPLGMPFDRNAGFALAMTFSGGSAYAAGCLQTSNRGTLQGQAPGYWVDGTWQALPVPGEDLGLATSVAVVQ